jgi:DNA-binding transcriptional MerR regulator
MQRKRKAETVGAPLKMRDLERLTGVNRETIRVYFREGLLPEPLRPKPNVAHYSDAHVQGILAVRNLHHGGRVPLQQIRRALDGDASAMPSDAAAFGHLESLVTMQMDTGESLVPLAKVEAQTPGAARDAKVFARVGAITLRRRDGELHLSRTDARLLELWKRMRGAGFSEANGFNAEVVDMYVDGANALAHVEVKRFLSIIRGRMDDRHAADLALTAIRVMLDFFGLLRMKAVMLEIKLQTEASRASRRR